MEEFDVVEIRENVGGLDFDIAARIYPAEPDVGVGQSVEIISVECGEIDVDINELNPALWERFEDAAREAHACKE